MFKCLIQPNKVPKFISWESFKRLHFSQWYLAYRTGEAQLNYKKIHLKLALAQRYDFNDSLDNDSWYQHHLSVFPNHCNDAEEIHNFRDLCKYGHVRQAKGGTGASPGTHTTLETKKHHILGDSKSRVCTDVWYCTPLGTSIYYWRKL